MMIMENVNHAMKIAEMVAMVQITHIKCSKVAFLVNMYKMEFFVKRIVLLTNSLKMGNVWVNIIKVNFSYSIEPRHSMVFNLVGWNITNLKH